MQAVAVRAVVRHVVAITVLPAVEARLQRTPLQCQHVGAGIRAPRAVVKPQAVARLAAGITAQPAVAWLTAE